MGSLRNVFDAPLGSCLSRIVVCALRPDEVADPGDHRGVVGAERQWRELQVNVFAMEVVEMCPQPRADVGIARHPTAADERLDVVARDPIWQIDSGIRATPCILDEVRRTKCHAEFVLQLRTCCCLECSRDGSLASLVHIDTSARLDVPLNGRFQPGVREQR